MPAPSLTHVILGDGVAGMSAAQIIRAKHPDDRIQIVSADPQPFYYRAALTNYLMGELSDEELWALPPNYWERLRLERIHGTAAGLDPAAKTVLLAGGHKIPYDRLLIATGTRSLRLQTPQEDPKRGVIGANLPGVQVLRTLADTRRIVESLAHIRSAVVLGGGILGIELAQGLVSRNIKVTLVHRGPWLMEKVVNRRAGELIQNRMARDGVTIYLNSGIQRINGSQAVRSVVLTDGTKIRCPLLVTSIGVVPNTEWLADSGLQLDKGYVPVDRSMRVAGGTNVWAAGDVAFFKDKDLPFANPGGLWQPARKQGEIAGLAMVEDQPFAMPEYRPGVLYNATRAWDLDLGTLGDHVDGEGTRHTFESRLEGRPIHKQVLVRDGHVVGALLLGDRREGHALRHLMNLKGAAGDVTSIADKLLSPDFDLPAWVASRAHQPNVDRYKKTVLLPAGPLPPSIAAAAVRTTQLQIAFPTPTPDHTFLAQAQAHIPLALRRRGDSRTFASRRIRVGRGEKCDEIVSHLSAGDEELILSLEGDTWVASSTRLRGPTAKVNGKPLRQPAPLQNGDFLALADWSALVELRGPSAASAEAPEQATLSGQQTHVLTRSITSLGSGRDNAIVLTGPGISLFHAQVHRLGQPAEFYLMDAGSQAGTLVNGRRVYAPVRLSPGDAIRIGSEELNFSRMPARQQPSPETAETAPLTGQAVPRPHVAPPPPLARPNAPAPPSANGGGRKFAFLIAEEGPLAGRTLQVPLPGVIGRSSQADVQIRDPLLSSQHARFEERGGEAIVLDLGSLNGITLDGRRVPADSLRKLREGSRLRLGRGTFRFSRHSPENFVAPRPPPDFVIPTQAPRLDAATESWNAQYSLVKQTVVLGRDADCDLVIPDITVSRKHARITRGENPCTLVDLESSYGSRVNGQKLAPQESVELADGDVIELGSCRIEFREPARPRLGSQSPSPPAGGAPGIAPDVLEAGYRVDWAQLGDPLSRDLAKTVREELDSCIGCHDCMRACPLPDAAAVSIAALNAMASGLSEPSPLAQRFVSQCTQCQACVPVCPVNIQRSRIVLWNKLKQTPSADQPVTIQVGDKMTQGSFTFGSLAERLAGHRVLGTLNGPERLSLLASARLRRVLTGETVAQEGVYLDAVWFILSGRLEVGMATSGAAFQRMIVLNPGQTVGETAVLSDQPSDVTAVAIEPALVLGLPKYAIKSFMQRSAPFRKALEALYVSRSVEVFFQRVPALAGLGDEVLSGLMLEFNTERYVPGKPILSANECESSLALVRRGFVKEIRLVEGQERVANYLKEGEAFGAGGGSRRGMLVRYEAATLCEVLTIDLERLRGLESRWPGLAARLLPATQATRGPKEGHTMAYEQAACAGLLQAAQLMVIDTRSCVDCNNCVDACERRHGTARLDRSNSGLQIGPFQVPASCFHCDDPKCLLCAVDGIVREPGGEIRIITENCIGCGACAERCPYDNIQMAPRENRPRPLLQRLLPTPIFDLLTFGRSPEKLLDTARIAVKCDLCVGHAGGPACVRSCPTGAAQRVSPLTFFGG